MGFFRTFVLGVVATVILVGCGGSSGSSGGLAKENTAKSVAENYVVGAAFWDMDMLRFVTGGLTPMEGDSKEFTLAHLSQLMVEAGYPTQYRESAMAVSSHEVMDEIVVSPGLSLVFVRLSSVSNEVLDNKTLRDAVMSKEGVEAGSEALRKHLVKYYGSLESARETNFYGVSVFRFDGKNVVYFGDITQKSLEAGLVESYNEGMAVLDDKTDAGDGRGDKIVRELRSLPFYSELKFCVDLTCDGALGLGME